MVKAIVLPLLLSGFCQSVFFTKNITDFSFFSVTSFALFGLGGLQPLITTEITCYLSRQTVAIHSELNTSSPFLPPVMKKIPYDLHLWSLLTGQTTSIYQSENGLSTTVALKLM